MVDNQKDDEDDAPPPVPPHQNLSHVSSNGHQYMMYNGRKEGRNGMVQLRNKNNPNVDMNRANSRRVNQEDISKRLSLPADLKLPQDFLAKLSLNSPQLIDGPLPRNIRRQSLVCFTRVITLLQHKPSYTELVPHSSILTYFCFFLQKTNPWVKNIKWKNFGLFWKSLTSFFSWRSHNMC